MEGSDEKLLDRAVRGDAAALKEMLARFGPRARMCIQGKIDRRHRSVLDEDDVMQVAYLEAFLHIDQLVSRDPNVFVGWLSRIAQNALRDAIRGFERDKRPNPANRVEPHSSESYVALIERLGVSATSPSRQIATLEARRTLQDALDRLPSDYQAVVTLCDLQGLEVAAAARQLGRSAGAVHMLRARAHDRLRALMGSGTQFFSEYS
ncbi:MAG: RNA polymerase sigma factor [Phycisphaerales bacterium]